MKVFSHFVRLVWNKWKAVAEKVGNFQATIIFSVLYFLLITPFGVISSLFKDSLKLKSDPSWSDVEKNSSNLQEMREQ